MIVVYALIVMMVVVMLMVCYQHGYNEGEDAGYSRGRSDGFLACWDKWQRSVADVNRTATTAPRHENTYHFDPDDIPHRPDAA